MPTALAKTENKKKLRMHAYLIIGLRGLSNHHAQAAQVSLPYMQITKGKLPSSYLTNKNINRNDIALKKVIIIRTA